MAQVERTLSGNYADWLDKIEQGILNGSLSASLESESDFEENSARCSVRVFERYSYTGGNRLSLTVVLFGDYDSVQAFAQDCRRVTDAVQQCSVLPDELRIAWAPDNDPEESLGTGTLQQVEQYTLKLVGIAQLDWTAEQMAKQTEIQYLLDEENEETAESKDASVESAELSE